LSYLANTQTNRQTNDQKPAKHNLFGEGNYQSLASDCFILLPKVIDNFFRDETNFN